MNTKNIIISLAALLVIAGIFLFRSGPEQEKQPGANDVKISEKNATSTSLTATSADAATKQEGKLSLPTTRLSVVPLAFHHDIAVDKAACGEKIGTFRVTNPDSSTVLWWQITGSKPIWLGLSSTWGKTPENVDMTYNCILSGAGNGPYDASFDIVQTTEDGKMLSGYLFTVKVDGAISGMAQ